MKNSAQAIAVPFFSESEWNAARHYMDDGDRFMDSYTDFLQRVAKFERKMLGQGFTTARVPLDRETISAWCRARGCKINAQARSEFAAWKLLDSNG